MAGPRTAVGWICFLDDGSSCSSVETKPEDIPSDGILIILQVFSNGSWERIHGQDYYLWNGEEWQAGTRNDLERWLRYCLPNLKYGRWATTSGWAAAGRAARKWTETHDLKAALDVSEDMTGRE